MALNLKGKDGFYGWVNVAVIFCIIFAKPPIHPSLKGKTGSLQNI